MSAQDPMTVTLLGTGAADGWPNPFCGCASCRHVVATGELRAQTSALVDGRLLLDCGPEAPRQALRAGVDLTGLEAVLVTHAHPDHFDPAVLLYRGWVTDQPLRVLGPPPVVDACRPWLAPGQDRVELVAVRPGESHQVAGHEVRVLAANHGAPGEAVLYELTGPAGQRLLYATDTAELPEGTVQALAGAGLDLLLLEQTFGDRTDLPGDHLTFGSFAATVDALRRVGAVTDRTDVVAVHLSHFNPPGAELAHRLAACGARIVPDGTRLCLPPRAVQPV
ncbi:MBL fold metallo-hydrolase [Oryzihumus sp.]|uniref:MBL fold metallo-hydrolase n=1 Tax=Oryzihumus sp. TaxID=1968903 RepID=UPI002ED9BDC7